MSSKKRVFLVDVDNTLLNTESIKSHWRKDLGKDFDMAYQKSKSSSGFLDVDKLAKKLLINKSYFYETPFQKFLFPMALKILKSLRKTGQVYIFSLGDKSYQKTKIHLSGIEDVVGKKKVIIVQDKNLGVINTLKYFYDKGHKEIWILDDRTDILDSSRKSGIKTINVWVKYGNYKHTQPKDSSSVDFEAKDLNEAFNFMQNYVGIIDGCVVFRGINKNQIRQLVLKTNKDSEVKKFTHDSKRFKSERSFNLWLKNEKSIYTLTDKKGILLGLIWFAKEKFKNYKYTIAIRTYPPIRGKGFATRFMKLAIKDFDQKSIWLKASMKNYRAISLYKKIGFKEDLESYGEICMHYT